MSFSSTSRFFVQFEVTFRPSHDRGKAMQLYDEDGGVLDAYTTLRRSVRSGQAKLTLGSSDELELLRLNRVADNKIIALLFKRADPNAPPQIYSHRVTRNIRRADKQKDEDVAYSAHLFIEDNNIGTINEPKYRALLEEVPGIAKSQIIALLKKIFSNEKYVYENFRSEEKETHTVVDMHGVPSDTLGDAIHGSRVPRITLIRKAEIDGLDTEGLASAREQRMPISLKATPDPISLIRRIKDWARTKGWTDFRVDIEMPEKRSRSIAMARDDDAAAVLFIRSIPIQLEKPIDTCVHQIVVELVQHARTQFGI